MQLTEFMVETRECKIGLNSEIAVVGRTSKSSDDMWYDHFKKVLLR